MNKLTLLITLLLSTFLSFSQEQNTKSNGTKLNEVASAYFQAFSRRDIHLMLSFYDSSIVYEDPTYIGVYKKDLRLKGKLEVFNLYDPLFNNQIRSIQFIEDNKFFSGNVGVFSGKIQMHYDGPSVGKNDTTTMLWQTDYVITLFFDGLKIIKEIDLINYENASFKPL